jgi:hypothetical protein
MIEIDLYIITLHKSPKYQYYNTIRNWFRKYKFIIVYLGAHEMNNQT